MIGFDWLAIDKMTYVRRQLLDNLYAAYRTKLRLFEAVNALADDDFIVHLYRVLLFRGPSLEERMQFWSDITKGLHRSQAVTRLLGSSEFRLSLPTARGLSSDERVARGYRDVLGRSVDPLGLLAYGKLSKKFLGGYRVTRRLRRSAEGRAAGGGRLAIAAYYRRYALHYTGQRLWSRISARFREWHVHKSKNASPVAPPWARQIELASRPDDVMGHAFGVSDYTDKEILFRFAFRRAVEDKIGVAWE